MTISLLLSTLSLLSLLSLSRASSCPLDLSYTQTLPWNSSSCQTNPSPSPNSHCCQTLISLYGIALAHRLKSTSLFHLPDLPTSVECLSNLQSRLSSLSLPPSLTSLCFVPDQFVSSRNSCASIQSTRDWAEKLAPETKTALDSACRPDLSDLSACDACVAAGFSAQSDLVRVDGNKSHATNCFYFAILYAAGVANEFGPESNGVLTCVFNLGLDRKPDPSKSHLGLVFGLSGAGFAVLVSLALLGFFVLRDRKKRRKNGNSNNNGGFDFDEVDEEGLGVRRRVRPNTGSIWFKFDELAKATEGFSQRNYLGRGGFGIVYKGVLRDGSVVAIKKMVESDFEGNEEFCNEVEIISNLRHRNLVPLRGCCVTGEEGEDDDERESQRFLVYDYMPNGNLEDHLFPSSSEGGVKKLPLTWPQRKNIILDVAKGLAYLHYGVKPGIYHRDIKATNILLDEDMKARVADFGLAKQSREGQSHLTTRVAGTHGYLAPEYALYGQLTEKSDVYSFGVVVLETLCGRKALDLSSDSPRAFLITDWAWSLVKNGKISEAVDPFLWGDGDSSNSNPKGIMERFLLVGILCAHVMVALRPTILEAAKMLEGDIEVPSIPDRPMPLGHPSFAEDWGTFSSLSPTIGGPKLQSGDMLK